MAFRRLAHKTMEPDKQQFRFDRGLPSALPKAKEAKSKRRLPKLASTIDKNKKV